MIDILLATFNGEKYVKQQVLSILSQTYTEWNLLIHDDGSTDGTLDIIEALSKIDARIKIIEDGLKFGSPALNFLHLVRHSKNDYVMFCDQDDIWFDNKVQLMYDSIRYAEIDVPVVAYSDSYVWHPSKGIQGYSNSYVARDLRHFLFQNGGVQGCSSIFNHKMANMISAYSGLCTMHDHLLQFIGCSCGTVLYIPVPLMLYRQHSGNFTGNIETINTFNKIREHSKIPVMTRSHLYANYDMIKEFRHALTLRDRQICNDYLNLDKKPLLKRLYLVIKDGFTLGQSKVLLIFKIMIRPFVG